MPSCRRPSRRGWADRRPREGHGRSFGNLPPQFFPTTDYFSSRTQTFTSDGTFLTRWYGGANDVAVDASDNVYVDSYSYVERFASCP